MVYLRFEVANKGKYYQVQTYCVDGSGYYQYKPLRNFRDQGDAIIYAKEDCPKIREELLNMTVKGFKPGNVYKRIKFNHYRKITITPNN